MEKAQQRLKDEQDNVQSNNNERINLPFLFDGEGNKKWKRDGV